MKSLKKDKAEKTTKKTDQKSKSSENNLVLKYVLKNSLDFGSVRNTVVLGLILRENPELKNDVPKLMQEINSIIQEVSVLSKEEIKSRLEKSFPELLVEKKEESLGPLKPLPNAEMGKVVTRLAPEPSKYNHIGHALVFLIQYLYAKMYKGKCILRFDDTNPEKSTQEYYQAMIEDLSWLGIKWDKELLASDDNPRLYQMAEKLIQQNQAYVCSCSQETIKKNRELMEPCKCRSQQTEKNLLIWKEMLARKFKEGEMILRLKGDMASHNGVMRDPVIFRICYAPHFRQELKYCVWPMYDFENPVEDALDNVTHVIRSKEFELRAELHLYIQKLLGLKSPTVTEIGRYNITGAETQGRVIREMIQSRKVMGWDDPRLVTIKALRRRGFIPEMFKELAQTVGLSKSGGHIDPMVLASANRSLIDGKVNRYFLVIDPIKIKIIDAPEKDVEIDLHPKFVERGKRHLHPKGEVYLSKKDSDSLEPGKIHRLMDYCNFKIEKGKYHFVSEDYEDYKSSANKGLIIHWLPVQETIKCSVLMDDAILIKGLGEKTMQNLKVNDLVQLEREFYARVDEKSKDELKFWYLHK